MPTCVRHRIAHLISFFIGLPTTYCLRTDAHGGIRTQLLRFDTKSCGETLRMVIDDKIQKFQFVCEL